MVTLHQLGLKLGLSVEETHFSCVLTSAEHNCVVPELQCGVWVNFVSEDISGT